MPDPEGYPTLKVGPGTPRPDRILILGPSGSGKTTLARRLGASLGLEIIHLDSHFWLPNWQASNHEDWENKLAELLKKEAWVMDGNYPRSLVRRLDRANLVVMLDFPRWKSLYRCVKRLVQNWGRTRSELAPGCREKMDWDFIKWIWSYPEVVRPEIQGHLETLPREKPVIFLRSETEVEEFLSAVKDGGINPGIARSGIAYDQ